MLNAGKDCYLEKPAAIKLSELYDLISTAHRSTGRLHLGFNRRFLPFDHLLRDYLDRETGPTFISVVQKAQGLDPDSWRYWESNGDRVISNICHPVDYCLYLLSHTVPIEVSATISELGRMDENLALSLKFADGSLASILFTNTMVYVNQGDPKHGFFQNYLIGRGGLFAENRNYTRLTVRHNGRRVKGWRGSQDIGHRRQLAELARVFSGFGPAPIDLRDLFVSSKTVLAASEAVRTRRRVALNFDEYESVVDGAFPPVDVAAPEEDCARIELMRRALNHSV